MNKEIQVTNKLPDAVNNFKAFESKLFWNIAAIYTYRSRQLDIKDNEITLDNSDVKKLISGKHITFDEYFIRINNMKNYITISYDDIQERAEMISVMDKIKINKENTTFSLSREIVKMLDMHDNYTIINLIELNKLKTETALKLYMICSKYKNLRNNYSMPIDKFLKFFDVSKSYRKCHIDQKILNPGIKEINEKTFFDLQILKIKKNRFITHYEFCIKLDEKKMIKGIDVIPKDIKKIIYTEKNKIQNVIQEEETEKEEIQQIIKQFRFKYNGNLDYILTNNLVKMKGLNCVNECLNEFVNFVGNANQVEKVFYDFVKKYGTEKAYKKATMYNNLHINKPAQALNYEQREYSDDYYNSLYDNVEFIK